MIQQLGETLQADVPALLTYYRQQVPCCIGFTLTHNQDYLPGNSTIILQAVILFERNDFQISIREFAQQESIEPGAGPAISFANYLHHFKLNAVSLNKPWPLDIVKIAKPWGAELWYTGIESRGICSVNGIALPWLLDILGETVLGKHIDTNPILLKILAPVPEASFGDLYFELHQEKIEVYVVTHIDKQAWPDGVGQIRYGFNRASILTAKSEQTFKTKYLKAVDEYKAIRLKIDTYFDTLKLAANLDINTPVSTEQLQLWCKQLDPDLSAKEQRLKQAMYLFTHLESVVVGDIITVKPFVAHSLLHGVRVVEFQSAHYERHILSFSQKVLTQSHWDTEAALDVADIHATFDRQLDIEIESPGLKIECIAAFPQFKALRITLAAHEVYQRPIDSYALVIGISGQTQVNEQSLAPESAVMVTENQATIIFKADDERSIILLALPNKTVP